MKIFLLECLANMIKIFLVYKILSYFGIILGIPLTYIIFTTYHFLMKKLLNLEYLSFDKSLIGYCSRDQYNINLIMVFKGNFNPDEIKKAIEERLINQIPKLHSRVVYKFFNYYWKEFPPNEAIKQIFFTSLKSKDEIENYLEKHLNFRINTLETFPFEIRIIEFNEKTDSISGAIHFKFDHILSDGLGLLSLCFCLCDDYSPEIYPKILRVKYTYSFIREILDTILFPLFSLYALFIVLTSSNERTEYKPMYNYHHYGISRFQMSKWYPLNSMKKLRAKYSVSFNTCVVGILLKAHKELLENIHFLNVIIPCGHTTLPLTVKDVKLKNLAQGFMMCLPCIDNFNELTKLHKIINTHIFNTTITSIPIIAFRMMSEFLPAKILNFIGNNIIFKSDILISNIPGPESKLKVCGCEMIDCYPVVSPGRMKAFFTISSFNGYFRYIAAFDKSVKYNLKDLMFVINKIMNDINDINILE